MTSAIYFTHLLVKSLDEIGAVAFKNKIKCSPNFMFKQK